MGQHAAIESLPEEHAHNLIEAFEVVQRLRLRYQIEQYEDGEKPSDLLVRDRLRQWLVAPDRDHGAIKTYALLPIVNLFFGLIFRPPR